VKISIPSLQGKKVVADSNNAKVPDVTIEQDIAAHLMDFRKVPPPTKNTDGATATAVLQHLVDAGLVGGIKWDMEPLNGEEVPLGLDPKTHEYVCLTVQKGADQATAVLGEDLSYKQVRNTNEVARQAVKQHLGSLALCDITGPTIRWSELSSKELKTVLSNLKAAS
jgi:hypothetical protein